MKKIFQVAGVLAVLGAGILLGKSIGRDNDLWLEPVAPDTGAGWVAPKITEEPIAEEQVIAATAPVTNMVDEAKTRFKEMMDSGPLTVAEARCDNPRVVYGMLIYVIAVASPQATSYPVAVSEGNFFLAHPNMSTATTEFVNGPSTYCSVSVSTGVVNQRTNAWAAYPPVDTQQTNYEIVVSESGHVRVHHLRDNGTRFN